MHLKIRRSSVRDVQAVASNDRDSAQICAEHLLGGGHVQLLL